ncbi:MAG: hypothetical protein NVS3B5_19150 [Sphingomicrobium sp.]
MAGALVAMRIVTSSAGFAIDGSTGGVAEVMVKVMLVMTDATASPTAFPHVG